MSNHGLDGGRTMDIQNMTSVQFKKDGLTSGYIQFIVKGSLESKGGVFSAARDENSVLFIKKEQKMAEEIKAYVKNIIADKNSNIVIDGADESRKFKVLLYDGIITEEEFNTKKKQTLGIKL